MCKNCNLLCAILTRFRETKRVEFHQQTHTQSYIRALPTIEIEGTQVGVA